MVLNLIVEKNGIGSSIYGVPGSTWYQANKDIDDFITTNKINYIHASNESSAIYMASVEALSSNKVGITFSTSGPGTLMAATGIGTSLYEANPLVSFFGVPVGNFQYIDSSIFSTICKKVFYIDTTTINPQTIISDAFTIAKNGTPTSPGKGSVAIFVLTSCWNTTYKYTNAPVSTLFYPNQLQNANHFSNKILSSINSSNKIIIRLGERVNPWIVKQYADLSNVHKNIFIMLTMLSKTYINPLDYPNVGIDGPIANKTINELYKNATLVIDAGYVIENNLILYNDVYPYMTLNTPLYYILNTKNRYTPASLNPSNTLYMDINLFFIQFLMYTIPSSSLIWLDVRPSESNFITTALNAYKSQTSVIDNATLTTISVVAHCFEVIYQHQTNPTIINDTLLYSTDVGLVSFLTHSFIRHQSPMAISILGEFSPIGSSISVTAGYLRSRKYTGAVIVIGDGGFLNVTNYLIDLCKVLHENPTYSILLLIMNDDCYTNVAEGERALFGNFTSITSTSSLQIGIDIGDIARSFFGTKLANYKFLSDLSISSSKVDLQNFISDWYENQLPGATILHYRSSIGQPYQIKSLSN
jgi:thiamine pyrophosphate-dependent acetolactate synthase large subunit-like protein